VIPGVVSAGAFDGHERACATKDSQLLWDFDMGRSFDAVNGGQATGGSIDQGGQQTSGSRLFTNSGASSGYHGNLLLVFAIGESDGQRTLAH
jgi:polyvinyl alcohol dehydrogenase (cytochrome)